jgi:hypothetical protein
MHLPTLLYARWYAPTYYCMSGVMHLSTVEYVMRHDPTYFSVRHTIRVEFRDIPQSIEACWSYGGENSKLNFPMYSISWYTGAWTIFPAPGLWVCTPAQSVCPCPECVPLPRVCARAWSVCLCVPLLVCPY